MNANRDAKVRVQDFTEPRTILRKKYRTITESGGLFHALGSLGNQTEKYPRLKEPRFAPPASE